MAGPVAQITMRNFETAEAAGIGEEQGDRRDPVGGRPVVRQFENSWPKAR